MAGWKTALGLGMAQRHSHLGANNGITHILFDRLTSSTDQGYHLEHRSVSDETCTARGATPRCVGRPRLQLHVHAMQAKSFGSGTFTAEDKGLCSLTTAWPHHQHQHRGVQWQAFEGGQSTECRTTIGSNKHRNMDRALAILPTQSKHDLVSFERVSMREPEHVGSLYLPEHGIKAL